MVRILVAALACASVFASSQASSAADLATDAAAFGARETIMSMDISPSGKFLLEKGSGKGRETIIRLIDLSTGKITPVIGSSSDPEKLDWCLFETDTQLVCRYSALHRYQDSIIGFSRIISISADGKQIKQLGQRRRMNDAGLRQSSGSVVDWLVNEPGKILMAREYVPTGSSTGTIITDARGGLGVDRVDLTSVKIQTIEPPRGDATDYLTDGQGNVRIMRLDSRDKETDQLLGHSQFLYRLPNSRDWKPLANYRWSDESGMYPLAVDGPSNMLYYLNRTDGRDALYRLRLDGTLASEGVAANDKVDISSIVRLGRGQRIIGYGYVDDRRQVRYFDSEIAKLVAQLGRVIPKLPVISFEEASADGSKLLIHASGDTNPGVYYLYDKATKGLAEVGQDREPLADRKLSPVKLVSVPGPGGVKIPAYLTMPAEGPATGLSAIVLPHGGPFARDEWGFDWLSQFLAARGYAVIQPNFRGSAGYGDDWLGKNAIRDWRNAINDITASARYLVESGIANGDRLAILGWSYGGYAALQSSVIEPNLYKAVVAIAPVTDFTMMKRQSEGFTNSELVKDTIGSGSELAGGSPLRNASAITAPVLMFHGDMDANVAIEQSDRMAAALRNGGKKVELVRFEGLDHQLDDSNARSQMLIRIGEFFDQTIGH